MLKSLTITFSLLIINSLIFINSVGANFSPQPTPPPKTKAQGTRGCPIPLGDLALFGPKEKKQQLILDVNIEQPLLLFQVSSEQSETVLITITEVQGKFQRQQIYEQKVLVRNSDYSVSNLPKLQPDRTYLLTLVLLCQDRPQYGKAVHTWLNAVDGQTQVNTFIQNREL